VNTPICSSTRHRTPGTLVTLPSLDSNEDETEDVNAPFYITPRVIKYNRKVGISGESIDPETLKEQMKSVTSIEKSAEVTKNLLQVVERSPLLRALDDESMMLVVKAFSGPIIVTAGADIITQGDIGDVFYLLEEGEVDVYVKKKDAAEAMKVHTYAAGDAFGELALMYNTPRAATCRAKVDCKVWSLDRLSFKCIIVAAAMLKRELYRGFLVSVPILSSLTELEIMTLADAMAEEKYEDGDIICRQGDDGKYFYLIREGEATCTIEDKVGNKKIVASLSTGNYFGEVALLTSKPRQATVQAKGGLAVLAVDRATFTRVLGSVEDIMMRNMEEYKKFAAQAI
jgi:cAMP-dependent protein kinase regulator